jgi:O-antigen/teichoic acid export membrane protein
VAINDELALRNLYHQSIQMTAVLILPVAAMLAFFSFDILILWTRNAEAARIVSPIVTLLVSGMALSGLMALTFALQLSYGWTSIMLRIHIFFIVTFVPSIFFMTSHYGAVGAAAAWLILNSIYILILVPLTHRRLLRGETRRVYIEDICPPLAATLLVVGAGRWLIVSPMPPLRSIVILSFVLLSALVSAALVAPHMRTWLFIQFDQACIGRWIHGRILLRKRR